MTQVLGALIVILGVVLAVLGTISTSRQSGWLGRAVFLVAVPIVGVQLWQTIGSSVAEERIRRQVAEAIRFLVDEADFASQLEYKMRGDLRPDTKEKLAEYVAQIERWRKRTGNALKERFPNTGGDRVFLAAVGDVGRGPIYYQYTRLRNSQTALFAILGSVDAFVRREQLVTSSPTAPDHSDKAATAWWMPSSDALLGFSTLALALFTCALVAVSWLQWRTLDATHKSNEVVERAYVGLSHFSPGLNLSAGAAPTAIVRIEAQNNGRTPADVTAISLGLRIEPGNAPLPQIPPYELPRQITAFLTTGATCFVHPPPWPIPPGDFAQVQAGTASLYLFGYIDYHDQFGRRHRHGYARVYDSGNPTNNLIFVAQPGYNYDRLLS